MAVRKKVAEKINSITLLDKYILKQVVEVFIMGVCVFTSIIFASDTFITLIKQISLFGIPFKVALMMIILNLPQVIVMTIPTILMSIFSFVINESVVPVMTKQSKDLALWALGQKNIPDGKQNFVFKELNSDGILKRLFYVGYCEDKTLHNITVLDTSKDGTIQVLQAQEGKTSPSGWDFRKGAVYTVGQEGNILNTTLFDDSNIKFGLDMSKELNKNMAKEMNFTQLMKFIAKNINTLEDKQRNIVVIELFDKLALPLTTIALVLIGVPLAITPPRVRYNRGFLFSILIIFAYYLIRALSISFGEAGSLAPFLAAWMPNIVLTLAGAFLYYNKVYTIE